MTKKFSADDIRAIREITEGRTFEKLLSVLENPNDPITFFRGYAQLKAILSIVDKQPVEFSEEELMQLRNARNDNFQAAQDARKAALNQKYAPQIARDLAVAIESTKAANARLDELIEMQNENPIEAYEQLMKLRNLVAGYGKRYGVNWKLTRYDRRANNVEVERERKVDEDGNDWVVMHAEVRDKIAANIPSFEALKEAAEAYLEEHSA